MIIDLSRLRSLTDNTYDVCIIGSGPAGSSLANVLADSRARICVLESGAKKTTAFSDALRDLDCEGVYIKPYSRERIVGGSTATWSGLSSPLDPIDFRRREWVRYSGWPIGLEELQPYYSLASKLFRFPEPDRFQDTHWMHPGQTANSLPVWEQLREKVFVAPATPQNFGTEYQEIYKQKNIDLFTRATVTKIDGIPENGRATKVLLKNPQNAAFAIKAKYFVLACGGIENPRLLLNSVYCCPNGLGNENDQVGRYFMNHLKNNYGFIKLRNKIDSLPGYFGFLSLQTDCAAYLGLRPDERVQKRLKLLNSYIRFQPMYPWSERESIESLMFLFRRSKLLLYGLKQLKKGQVLELRDYSETGDDSPLLNERNSFGKIIRMLFNIGRDLPAVIKYLHYRLLSTRKPRIRIVQLRNFMEMEPLPTNRVTLSKRTDAFGMPLPKVNHEPGELDKYSMAAVHQILSGELSRTGFGEMISPLSTDAEPWPIDYDASHHIGTTRMGSDPLTSVVNKDCRLHYSPNVYIAGSSVFPTGGNANPTYTLVALAIRLGEHIKQELQKRPQGFSCQQG